LPADAAAGARPTVGSCHSLSVDEIGEESDSRPTVSCTRPHTTRTIRVPLLPEGVDWNADPDKLFAIATRLCLPAFDKALGRTAKIRDRSAYAWVWFVPTASERDDGARWLRCDLVLYGGNTVLGLPTDKVPALDKVPLPDSVARCLHPSTLATTTCSREHTWRATGAFTLNQARYPSDRRLRAAALNRCPALVTSRTLRWSVRSKTVWKLGDHAVVCYSKTRS
jgi:hypothetical protein